MLNKKFKLMGIQEQIDLTLCSFTVKVNKIIKKHLKLLEKDI